MELTETQRSRYARQLVLKNVGPEGQEKLLSSRVLIIGAGGLGSPAALYLAAAGVGALGIADADRVELSNLQRQILHGTPSLGRPKVLSARARLEELNPDVTVRALETRVTAENIGALVRDYDFVVDATDSFASKFLINDGCVRAGVPFCHGAVAGFSGQLMTWIPGQGPCYRCVFGAEPAEGDVPTPRETGVIGAAAGVVGCLQALEALKYLLGAGDLLTSSLLTVDALFSRIRRVPLPPRNKDCPACGGR